MRTTSVEGRVKRFFAGAMAACVLAGAGVSVQAQTTPVPTLTVPDFTEVVAQSEGSVVNIRTTESIPVRSQMGPGTDPYELFRWFFGPDFVPPGRGGPPGAPAPDGAQPQERTVPRGVGSGFIISEDGYILTNTHVVAGASDIHVTFTDGQEYEAEVIGTDARTDVALIKIDAKNLKPLPIGTSTTLKKGQWVLAIGSPFGLESTVTSGIVSAINRDTGDYLPFIQTDVAVNPGNSGGPLLNLGGEVVGINSQIVSRSGGFMGISLAIPIDEAMRVVEQLKEHGKVTRGRIGVQIGPVSEEVAKAIGLDSAKGAMVSHVQRGGPADKAGVQAGDVITDFNGEPILQWSDLPRIVGGTKPDTRATMKVWRKGKEVSLRVRVGEFETDDAATPSESGSQAEEMATNALGLGVQSVPAEILESENLKQGVMVTAAKGPAAMAGIAPGDIILTVNETDITNPEQFAKTVAGLDTSETAALLVYREGQTQWVVVTPTK
ncbi:DegQ family serine endoprotease [Neopusillimonas maritima]|uniref:Probable periplasmic serine endoprotease DegP-like n=1 Tax=Neopusillimonas maritima TaxID=2026239 RepID=A0ABX9N4F7_9BURK|nr:DegQ family serine endoprotease [Neopusillimonas maritima]RII84602.1 serine peptidase [Neopusillimonas maritima]